MGAGLCRAKTGIVDGLLALINFVPIVLGATITALLALRSWRNDRRSRAAGVEPPLEGFGGWLLFLAFGVIFGAWVKIRNIVSAYGFFDFDRFYDEIEHYKLLIAFTLLTAALQIVLVYVMLRKRRAFVGIFLLAATVYLCTEAVVRGTFLLSQGAWSARQQGYAIGFLLAELGPVVVAIAYVLRSRRVKNTFVR